MSFWKYTGIKISTNLTEVHEVQCQKVIRYQYQIFYRVFNMFLIPVYVHTGNYRPEKRKITTVISNFVVVRCCKNVLRSLMCILWQNNLLFKSFGVCKILVNTFLILCSPMLHWFDKKYCKCCYIILYCFFIIIFFQNWIHVISKINFQQPLHQSSCSVSLSHDT